MIGVLDQIILVFTIDTYKDFLTTQDFNYLTIVEEAGNILPTFECSFTTRDAKVLKYVNEGNIFNVSLGKKVVELTTSKFCILNKEVAKQGSAQYNVIVRGILAPINYLSDSITKIFGKQTSLAVLTAIASQSKLRLDSNLTPPPDKMNWIQYGISNKEFVNEVMIHSNLPGSFMGVGITMDHKMVLRDVKKTVAKEPDWIWVSGTSKGPKQISCQILQEPRSDSGFLNLWAGYIAEVSQYNIDTATMETERVDTKNLLAQSKTFDRTGSVVKPRPARFEVKTENAHDVYHVAKRKNLMNLALNSSVSIIMEYSNRYVKQQLYDTCVLLEEKVNAIQRIEEAYSGKYIITRISRNYTANALHTCVTINRESFSEMKGTFQ